MEQFEDQIIALIPRLKRYSNAFCKNTDDQDDLVQDTLLKALRYKDTYNDHGNLMTWLGTVMKNSYLDKYRVMITKQENYQSFKDNHPIQITSHVFDSLHLQDVKCKLEQLPEKFKRPIIMYVKGYSYEYISKELGVGMNTVKSYIFRARQELLKIE